MLARLGGLEIAALVGFYVEAAAARRALVIDGFIATSAACLTARLRPHAVDGMIAAHLSTEPGHRLQLDDLGLDPLLGFDMRLGERSGAAVALPVIDAAAAILREMATFDEAGVVNRLP